MSLVLLILILFLLIIISFSFFVIYKYYGGDFININDNEIFNCIDQKIFYDKSTKNNYLFGEWDINTKKFIQKIFNKTYQVCKPLILLIKKNLIKFDNYMEKLIPYYWKPLSNIIDNLNNLVFNNQITSQLEQLDYKLLQIFNKYFLLLFKNINIQNYVIPKKILQIEQYIYKKILNIKNTNESKLIVNIQLVWMIFYLFTGNDDFALINILYNFYISNNRNTSLINKIKGILSLLRQLFNIDNYIYLSLAYIISDKNNKQRALQNTYNFLQMVYNQLNTLKNNVTPNVNAIQLWEQHRRILMQQYVDDYIKLSRKSIPIHIITIIIQLMKIFKLTNYYDLKKYLLMLIILYILNNINREIKNYKKKYETNEIFLKLCYLYSIENIFYPY